jgi:outer membrane usher protein FimD/PapC
MSVTLPGWALPIELFLGPPFPDGKEDTLMSMGDSHEQHGARMKGHLSDAHGHEQRLVSTSTSSGVNGLHARFTQTDGAHNNLVDASTGSHVIGLGLKTSGGVVLAHKGVTLLQYGITAASLASAAAAPGIGEVLMPLIQQAGRRAIDYTANTVATQVLA